MPLLSALSLLLFGVFQLWKDLLQCFEIWLKIRKGLGFCYCRGVKQQDWPSHILSLHIPDTFHSHAVTPFNQNQQVTTCQHSSQSQTVLLLYIPIASCIAHTCTALSKAKPATHPASIAPACFVSKEIKYTRRKQWHHSARKRMSTGQTLLRRKTELAGLFLSS